jgi:glycerol-3-phosphate acyltransferase PlsY
MLLWTLSVGLSYLLGSLSSAIIVCRIGGYPDPRSLGSGNPGATNVLRIAGRRAAALTLAGDLLKGLMPLALGHWLRMSDGTLAVMGLAAFLGHLYPVFFGFRGGKGVATFIGVLYGLAWQAGLAFMGLWLAVAGLFRYSSLAALVAASLSPIAVALVHPSPPYIVAVTAMAGVILWRHRSNIRNLMAGTERKIGAPRE